MCSNAVLSKKDQKIKLWQKKGAHPYASLSYNFKN
ncbi:hypothetical protein FLCH110379_04770 [Flavobacterium chungbukense]